LYARATVPSLSTYAVFVATCLALLAIPGPAVLYVVSRSIDQGRRAGLASVLGITTGTIVHVTLATVGLSSLILASRVAFDAVRFVGAAYLIYLGVRRLLSHARGRMSRSRARRAPRAISTRRG
jgi:threonine/homoserine/homoserine lactone efflux protein